MKIILIKIFRWVLIVLSGIIITSAVSMLIYNRLYPEGQQEPLSFDAIIGLSVWGVGLLGLVIAWKWELIGSLISLTAFIIAGIQEPDIWTNPLMLIWPTLAIFFLAIWVLRKRYL